VNPSLASCMSDPLSKAKSKKSGKCQCKHCGKNGHYTDQCRNIGKNKCRLCDGYGHDADECKKDNDQSQNGKCKYKNNGSSSNKRSKNDAQNADDTTQQSVLHGQLVALNANNRAGAKAYDDYNSYNSYQNVSSDSEYNDGQTYDWLVDTGTTSHITHRREAFATYETILRVPISGVGGIQTFVIGKGTVFLLSKCNGYMNVLQLNNVLHVPSNRNSLLSLGNWEENGRSIHAHCGVLCLMSTKGKDIAHGNKIVNKLYMMKFRLIDQSAPANIAFNTAFIVNDPTPSWETWHQHYGHVRYPGLQTLLDQHMVEGLNMNLLSPKLDCIACIEAKIHEAPYGPTTKKYTKPGELTHMDLWGKYDVMSIHGHSYYLLMVDDASWYITVEFLKAKSDATAKIKDYLAYLAARDKTPCALRMDRGTEFVNEELRTWCHSQGIRFQLTAPYSPSQNSIMECMNCTLVELARAMLAASELPEFLWEPAITHAAYVRNLAYTKFLLDTTPYQIWHGRKPNVAHLRKFGAPIWVLSQGQHVIWKMLPKSQCRAYVGHDDGSKAIKYYNAATRNILTSRNFRFLVPSTSSPSEELAIDPGMDNPPREGEAERDTRSVDPVQRAAENYIDVDAPRKTRGV